MPLSRKVLTHDNITIIIILFHDSCNKLLKAENSQSVNNIFCWLFDSYDYTLVATTYSLSVKQYLIVLCILINWPSLPCGRRAPSLTVVTTHYVYCDNYYVSLVHVYYIIPKITSIIGN